MTDPGIENWFRNADASDFREFVQRLVSGVDEEWVADVPPGPPEKIDVVLTRLDGARKLFRLVQTDDVVGSGEVVDAAETAEMNDAEEAVVMTNSGFGGDARRRANELGVSLFDGDSLREVVSDRGISLHGGGLEERVKDLVKDWPDAARERAIDVVGFIDSLADFDHVVNETESGTELCYVLLGEGRDVGGESPLVKTVFSNEVVSMSVLLRVDEGYTTIGEVSLGGGGDSREMKRRIKKKVEGVVGGS